MRTALGIATLACLGLMAGSALAQHVGDPAPDFEIEDTDRSRDKDDEHRLSTYKGRIVLLFFWRSTSSRSLDMIPTLNEIHREYRPRGVMIIAGTPEEKKDVEEVANEKQVEFFIGYGNAHRLYQVPSLPYAYLIDPDMKVAWRGNPEKNLEDRLVELMRRTPPVCADLAAEQSRLRKAEQLLEQRDYGRAYTIAAKLADLEEENAELAEKARALMEKLEQAAEKWLEEAKEAHRTGDYETACRIVSVISIRFETTDVAHAAEDEIARLRAERKSKEMIRTERKKAQAEVALDEAADFEADKRYLKALDAYEEVAKKFKDSEAAKQAQAAIERITTDSAIQQYVKEWREAGRADRWLELGDRFAKVEMYDLAREYYERVISEHATSAAATKAKKRLKDLPEPLAEEARKGKQETDTGG
jgi:peroxiredoxin